MPARRDAAKPPAPLDSEPFHFGSTLAPCCAHSSRLRLVAVCTFDDAVQIRLANQPARLPVCNSAINTPTDVRQFLCGSEFENFLRDRIVELSCSNSNKVCANPNSTECWFTARRVVLNLTFDEILNRPLGTSAQKVMASAVAPGTIGDN